MNVFRTVFPDFIAQEMSKVLKIFIISFQGEENEMDWKDYMMKTFRETETLFVSTGADILASDYKLSKHPLMQKLFDRPTVVAEFTNTFHAFEALLQLSDAVVQRSTVK